MKSKAAIVLFALLFAAGFGAGGYFGVASLAGQLNGWWRARSWQPVSATILDAAFEKSYGDTATYRVTARYRYVFEGRSYEGTRVGFGSGSDNVGSWQHNHYTRLVAAQHAGRAIEVWVDPANPERSVIDRNIRWIMIAFSLPFATLFPLVSIGALWVMVRTLRTPAQELTAPPTLARNANEIQSNARSSARGLWVFAVLWGLIAFPIAFVVVPEQFGRSWIWLFVMLFPLIGIALIWAAAARTIRLIRNGEIAIALNPREPRVGESLSVQTKFTRTPPAGEYIVSLLCEEVDTRGEDTRRKTTWRQERVVPIYGTHAAISFLPPAHLPASQPHAGVYHRWSVLIGFPDGKDERDFEVTIGPPDSSTSTQSAAPEHMETLSDDGVARPVPESVATIVDEFSRLKINYAANARGSGIGILLFALIFAGVGAFLLFDVAGGAVPKLMGSLFMVIGIALIAAAIYMLTHRRMVEISNGRLRVENHWLFKSSRRESAIGDVAGVVSAISGATTVGSKRYDHHELKALLNDGGHIVLASDIRDAGVALTLKRLLERRLDRSDDVETPAMHRVDRSKISPANPAYAAQAVRVRNRFMMGLKIFAALWLLAVFWDFFGEFFFTMF